jgi:hypothetical protein
MQEEPSMSDDEPDTEEQTDGAKGDSGAKDSPPPKPDPDDDSSLGDTDQHSGANA